METTFEVGQKAVYPAQGVAEVTAIETKEISGHQEQFYMLCVMDSAKKVMIPVSKVSSVGLRPVIEPSQVPDVYTLLRERDVVLDQTTWNRRYRKYLEKIKSGAIEDVAEVMRDLYILRTEKPLSFGERKMLETARHLLVQELCVSEGKEEETVLESLREIFGDDSEYEEG